MYNELPEKFSPSVLGVCEPIKKTNITKMQMNKEQHMLKYAGHNQEHNEEECNYGIPQQKGAIALEENPSQVQKPSTAMQKERC